MIRGERHELVPSDDLWPARLRDLGDGMPSRLHVIGDPSALARPMVAVVGSRRGPEQGQALARACARRLSLAAVPVLSFGDSNITEQLLEAAMEDPSAPAPAVILGTGADVAYPGDCGGLYERVVARGGAVASTEPWGAAPSRVGFGHRTSAVVALARAVVVSESDWPGRAAQAAMDAAAMGRPVLAFRLGLREAFRDGNARLLDEGLATPVRDTRDLVPLLERAVPGLVSAGDLSAQLESARASSRSGGGPVRGGGER